VGFKEGWFEQIRQFNIFANYVARHIEYVLEGIYALEKNLAIVHDQFEALSTSNCEFPLVFTAY